MTLVIDESTLRFQGPSATLDFKHLLKALLYLDLQVRTLSAEVNELRETNRSIVYDLGELKQLQHRVVLDNNLEQVKKRSIERAKRWREALGMTKEAAEVDGFAAMSGVLKKYKTENDDAVELLRRYREDE